MNVTSPDKDTQSKDAEVKNKTKVLELWLGFLAKFSWPLVLLFFLIVFSGEISGLFERLSKLSIAGQEFSFSEKLTESVNSLSKLTDITDSSIEIYDDTLTQDAYFQACKRYVVMQARKIPDADNGVYDQAVKIMEVIRSSLTCGEFIGLIVLAENDKYVGAFGRDFFLETLVPWSKIEDFKILSNSKERIKWLERETIFAFALRYPEKRIESGEGYTDSVTLGQTVSEALDVLIVSGKEFIGVVDNFGRFQGVITRSALINDLLQSLEPDDKDKT